MTDKTKDNINNGKGANTPIEGAAVIDFPNQGSIDDQAAEWVATLDGDQLDKATVQQFKQWLNQSPEHRASFERHQGLWSDMNRLAQILPPTHQSAGSHQSASSPAAAWWQLLWGRSLLAGVALLCVVLLTMGGDQRYRTAIGEQKSVLLDDGTSVLLNTDTELLVDYSRSRRQIYLLQGEAHFDIAHNPERPFEVFAGEGGVRAIGTAFSVYLRSDDVEVVVTEGTVEILSQSPANPAQLAAAGQASEPAATEKNAAKKATANTVTAGHVVTYDRHTAEHVMQQALADSRDKLSWHNGMLVFRSEPLENVIAEVNRYTPLNIVIPDQAIRALKVGGFFKVSDIQSVFKALEEGFDIHAEAVSDDVIYLVYRGQ